MDPALAGDRSLISAGIRDTGKILFMTEAEWRDLPGVKSMAPKYVAAMQKVLSGQYTLPLLMKASGCFAKGIGETRLDSLHAHDPRMLTVEFRKMASNRAEAVSLIAAVKGCGSAFAELYVDGFAPFWTWMRTNEIQWSKLAKVKPLKAGPLSGKSVSWTGYRSAEEEQRVNDLGGQVVAFGGKTTVLVYSPNGKSSSKVDKAREKGLQVTTFQQLVKGK
jgi:NAD-dependent DNA ligase